MQREVYPCTLRVDGQVHHLLWDSGESSDTDRVLAVGDLVLTFASERALRDHAVRHGIELNDPGKEEALDVDRAIAWLDGGPMPGLDVLLNLWNLAGDVARGTGRPWHDRSEDLDHVYELLFYGNNLPAVTPPGEHFVPQWTEDEMALLRRVTGQGITLIRRSLGGAER